MPNGCGWSALPAKPRTLEAEEHLAPDSSQIGALKEGCLLKTAHSNSTFCFFILTLPSTSSTSLGLFLPLQFLESNISQLFAVTFEIL